MNRERDELVERASEYWHNHIDTIGRPDFYLLADFALEETRHLQEIVEKATRIDSRNWVIRKGPDGYFAEKRGGETKRGFPSVEAAYAWITEGKDDRVS